MRDDFYFGECFFGFLVLDVTDHNKQIKSTRTDGEKKKRKKRKNRMIDSEFWQ